MGKQKKDFEEAVRRCEKALSESEEYMLLQNRCAEAYRTGDLETYSDLACELQALAETECYGMGLKDACTHFCTRI